MDSNKGYVFADFTDGCIFTTIFLVSACIALIPPIIENTPLHFPFFILVITSLYTFIGFLRSDKLSSADKRNLYFCILSLCTSLIYSLIIAYLQATVKKIPDLRTYSSVSDYICIGIYVFYPLMFCVKQTAYHFKKGRSRKVYQSQTTLSQAGSEI